MSRKESSKGPNLNETALKLLRLILQEQTTWVSEAAEKMDYSTGMISDYSQVLEERKLIDSYREGGRKWMQPTVGGRNVVEWARGGERTESWTPFVHKTVARFPIENSDVLSNDWLRLWKEKNQIQQVEHPENDALIAEKEDVTIFISSDCVHIMIPNRTASDVWEVAESVYQEAKEKAKWIEQNSPAELSSFQAEKLRMHWQGLSDQHIGLMDYPLARWVDEQPGLKKSDLVVLDERDRRWIYLDDSPRLSLESESSRGLRTMETFEKELELKARMPDRTIRNIRELPRRERLLWAIGDIQKEKMESWLSFVWNSIKHRFTSYSDPRLSELEENPLLQRGPP